MIALAKVGEAEGLKYVVLYAENEAKTNVGVRIYGF